MSAARIGKVRMKAGGAEVRLLPQPPKSGNHNVEEIGRHARMIADMDEPGSELIGYALVGIFADGKFTSGVRLDKSAFIGRTLLPSFVAEIIRRDLIMEPLAKGEI